MHMTFGDLIIKKNNYGAQSYKIQPKEPEMWTIQHNINCYNTCYLHSIKPYIDCKTAAKAAQ